MTPVQLGGRNKHRAPLQKNLSPGRIGSREFFVPLIAKQILYTPVILQVTHQWRNNIPEGEI